MTENARISREQMELRMPRENRSHVITNNYMKDDTCHRCMEQVLTCLLGDGHVATIRQNHRKDDDQERKAVRIERIGPQTDTINFKGIVHGNDQFDGIDKHPGERSQ
jgi:hypothetical protein